MKKLTLPIIFIVSLLSFNAFANDAEVSGAFDPNTAKEYRIIKHKDKLIKVAPEPNYYIAEPGPDDKNDYSAKPTKQYRVIKHKDKLIKVAPEPNYYIAEPGPDDKNDYTSPAPIASETNSHMAESNNTEQPSAYQKRKKHRRHRYVNTENN